MKRGTALKSIPAIPDTALIDWEWQDPTTIKGPDTAVGEDELQSARFALRESPRDPDRLNRLGLSLMRRAGARQDAAALGVLEEAQRRFERASEEARLQSAPPAARDRYDINRAITLWMLGERLNDQGTLTQALEILDPIIKGFTTSGEAIPQLLHDQARALDIQATVLIALGQRSKAMDAYQAALERERNPRDTVRILRNLAIALGDAGRYAEARDRLIQGIRLLEKSPAPLLWAKLHHSLGDVLSGWAHSCQDQPVEARQRYAAALDAHKEARSAYKLSGAADEARSMALGIANDQVALGGTLFLSQVLADHHAGIAFIHEAIILLGQASPEFSAADRADCAEIVATARALLAQVAKDTAPEPQSLSRLASAMGAALVLSRNIARRVEEGAGPSHGDWPDETYSQSPEAGRGGGGIVLYLERVWANLIAEGRVTRPMLRKIDPSADQAVANYLRGGKNTLPLYLHIPTKSEVIDEEARSHNDPGSRPARLDWALRRRKGRQRKT